MSWTAGLGTLGAIQTDRQMRTCVTPQGSSSVRDRVGAIVRVRVRGLES